MKYPKGMPKNTAKILRKAQKAGWRNEVRKSSHILCFSPDGKTIVVVSLSPHDNSSTKKMEADFRRGGLDI